MKSSKETYEKIAAYILGELEGDALKSFEAQMTSDNALKQEVKLHRSLAAHFDNKDEKAFQRNISKLRNDQVSRSTPSNKKWLWLAIFVLMAILIFVGQKFLFDQPNISPVKIEDKTDVVKPIVEEHIKKTKTDVIEDEGLNSVPDVTKELSPKSVVKERKIPTEKAKVEKSVPLAMADFEPNKSLELLINGVTRGLGSDFMVLDNLRDQSYSLNVPVDILFSGTIDTSSNLIGENLTMYIFSNKVKDYDSFKPLSSSNPVLEKIGTGYKLRVDKKILLKPGLYYYILETTEEEELIYIDKFTVK